MIGKIWVDCVINQGVINAAIGKIWLLSSKATFKEVGSNVFTVSFANRANKYRVEQGKPWLLDNHIFVLEHFDGLTLPKDMRFDKASLWLHLLQLPLMGMNRIVGERVGSSLGEVEKVKVEEDDISWEKKLRVRVKLELKKPLARGMKITLMGEKYWIPICYEKSP